MEDVNDLSYETGDASIFPVATEDSSLKGDNWAVEEKKPPSPQVQKHIFIPQSNVQAESSKINDTQQQAQPCSRLALQCPQFQMRSNDALINLKDNDGVILMKYWPQREVAQNNVNGVSRSFKFVARDSLKPYYIGKGTCRESDYDMMGITWML